MILIIENHDFRSKTTLICKKYIKNTNCCGNLKKSLKKGITKVLQFIEKIVKKLKIP